MVSETNTESLVSIIITTYNRSHYLKETLASIQNQSYSCIEIIVIDDGSESDIALINKKIAGSFSKCTYYYKENSGQPDSRNYGIIRSKGDLIGFCDDDDYWALDKLEKQISIFEKEIEYDVVNSCIEYVEEDGKLTGDIKCHEGFNHGYIFEHLLVKNRTASITPLLKREVFYKAGYFNKDFTISEDWDFWRRVSYYYKFYTINEALAYVRLHPKNMSKSKKYDPLSRFLIYRKVTKSLLDWGEDKFSKKERNLIEEIEWQHYRKILENHCPGVLKKMKFLKQIMQDNIKNGFHIIYLFSRFY